MKKFVKAMDKLPLIVKIILALPGLDIIWNIVRLCLSIAKNNVGGVILGIVLLIVGIPFMWLIDIITLIFANRILWVD